MSTPRTSGRGKVRPSETGPAQINKNVSETAEIEPLVTGMLNMNISTVVPGSAERESTDANCSSKVDTVPGGVTDKERQKLVDSSYRPTDTEGAVRSDGRIVPDSHTLSDTMLKEDLDADTAKKHFFVKNIPANVTTADLLTYLTQTMPGEVCKLEQKDDTAAFYVKSSDLDINWQQVDSRLTSVPLHLELTADQLVVEPCTEMVKVAWLSDKVTDEMLGLYFSNNKHTGMCQHVVESIYRPYRWETMALVEFNNATGSEIANLCRKRHELAGNVASVSPWFGSKEDFKRTNKNSLDYQKNYLSLGNYETRSPGWQTEGFPSSPKNEQPMTWGNVKDNYGRYEFSGQGGSLYGTIGDATMPLSEVFWNKTFSPDEIPVYKLLQRDREIKNFPIIQINLESLEVVMQGSPAAVKLAKDVLSARKWQIAHDRQPITPQLAQLLQLAGGKKFLEDLLEAEDIMASVEIGDQYLKVYVMSSCDTEVEFALTHILSRKLKTDIIPLRTETVQMVKTALVSKGFCGMNSDVLVEVHGTRYDHRGQCCVTIQGFKPHFMKVVDTVKPLLKGWRDHVTDDVNVRRTVHVPYSPDSILTDSQPETTEAIEGVRPLTGILYHPRDEQEVMCTVELPLTKSVVRYVQLQKPFIHVENIFREFKGFFYVDHIQDMMCYKHPKSLTNAGDIIKQAFETCLYTGIHAVCQGGCSTYFTQTTVGKERLASLEQQYDCAIVLQSSQVPKMDKTFLPRMGRSRQVDPVDTTIWEHYKELSPPMSDKTEQSKEKHEKGAKNKTPGGRFRKLVKKGRKLISRSGSADMQEYSVGDLRLILKQGDITKCKVTVLVNPVNTSLSLRLGHLSKIILEKAGHQLKVALDGKPKPKPGEIVGTRSYGLSNCEYIYHAVLPSPSTQPDVKVLQQLFTEALTRANSHESKSIVFPALGCGGFGLHIKTMVDQFLHSLFNFVFSGRTIKLESVTLCIYNKSVFQQVKSLVDESLSDEPSTGQESQTLDMVDMDAEPSASDPPSHEVARSADVVDEGGCAAPEEPFLKHYASRMSGTETLLIEITARNAAAVDAVKANIDEIIKVDFCEMICKPQDVLSEKDEKELQITALQSCVVYMLDTDKRSNSIFLKGLTKDVEKVCTVLKLTPCEISTPAPRSEGRKDWIALSNDID